jgi:hypothetical protein
MSSIKLRLSFLNNGKTILVRYVATGEAFQKSCYTHYFRINAITGFNTIARKNLVIHRIKTRCILFVSFQYPYPQLRHTKDFHIHYHSKAVSQEVTTVIKGGVS